MALYLVRHARTAWNADGRIQGHTDSGLDDVGRGQAAALAGVMRDRGLRAIWSSDLQRCRETADPVAAACGLDVRTTADLRERNYGRWEGRTYAEVREEFMRRAGKVEPWRLRPPGGESQEDVAARLATAFERILADPLPVLVVSHGGALGVLVSLLVGAGLPEAATFRFPNAAVTVLEPDASAWRLAAFADISHLDARG